MTISPVLFPLSNPTAFGFLFNGEEGRTSYVPRRRIHKDGRKNTN